MTYIILGICLMNSIIIGYSYRKFKTETNNIWDEITVYDTRVLNKIMDIKNELPKLIEGHLSKDEALAIVYSIISLRGEFLYNFARKMAEKPPEIGWYLEMERKTLTERLCKTWPDKKQSEVEELVNEFYNPNK